MKSKGEYAKELRADIRNRRGGVPKFLASVVKTAAGLRQMEDAVLETLVSGERPNLIGVSKGSMGQLKMEQNPLIATYITVVRQLFVAYRSLGISYDTAPERMEGDGKGAPDALEEFMKSMRGEGAG